MWWRGPHRASRVSRCSFKLSAVTDERKSKKIGQLKKAFNGSRDKLEIAGARIAALEQHLTNVVAS